MTKRYAVKEIVLTRQGEGFYTGRRAVFLRFSGCNLWSGREEDRASAVCTFCDTDFVGTNGVNGGRYECAEELAEACVEVWNSHSTLTDPLSEHPLDQEPFIVCTGGEPLLQLDAELIKRLKKEGFTIAVETNGTRPCPSGVDWICVSPKTLGELAQTTGDELKLVYPQTAIQPKDLEHLRFSYYYLQPMDGPNQEENRVLTFEYIAENPRWLMSEQFHKVWSIP